MRRSTWLVAMGAVLAMLAGQAAVAQASKPNSQQEKMTTCSADAKAKGLTGTERKAFMKSCLSGKSEAATTGASSPTTGASSTAGASGSAAATGNSQQEKMKSCNVEAKTKGLKGAERKTFMKDCLSGAAPH